MAYVASDLFKVGGANPGMWIYKSTEAVSAISGSGYFNSATNELKQFDVIVVISATGGTAAIDLVTVITVTGAATVNTVALA